MNHKTESGKSGQVIGSGSNPKLEIFIHIKIKRSI